MYTFVTTLILTFVCFNAYVYGESDVGCKCISSSLIKTVKQGMKGEKGEKPVVDYSTINATIKSYIRKERSSVAANSVRMMEKKFENLATQIDDLILTNAEQARKIINLEEKSSVAENNARMVEKKFENLNSQIDDLRLKNTGQEQLITQQPEINAGSPESKIRDNDRMIRLVNGNSIKNGRIEVLHDGTWGTVCDDRWIGTYGKHNADLACRQLGFSRSTWFEVSSSRNGSPNSQRYGAGTGQIWLDNVQCTGSENTLSDCAHSGWGQEDCGHYEDAAVECE